jgi:hypothetical protein
MEDFETLRYWQGNEKMDIHTLIGIEIGVVLWKANQYKLKTPTL